METLQRELDRLVALLPAPEQVRARLADLVSIYPFNEYEYVIAHLLAQDVLSLEQYLDLRDAYLARNLYLFIFEIGAPRTFGEQWAQGHLKELVPELVKPTRQLDAAYAGQYDLLLDGKIRIEVKASRAVDAEREGPLYTRALATDSTRPFWMNFQQIKPGCCDVLVCVGVWRDAIRYWVLNSQEVTAHARYSPVQHRGGVGEGQMHLKHDTRGEFDQYAASSAALLPAIRAAFARRPAADRGSEANSGESPPANRE